MTDRRGFFRRLGASVLALFVAPSVYRRPLYSFDPTVTVRVVGGHRMAALMSETNIFAESTAVNTEALVRMLNGPALIPPLDPPQWWIDGQAELGRS